MRGGHMKKKFKSIVMNVWGFAALSLSSTAVAAPTYTVAWYANPCITNVTYSASAVFVSGEESAPLATAWATVKDDINIAGKTEVCKVLQEFLTKQFSAAQIFNIFLREVQIFNVMNDLFQSGSNGITAVTGIGTVKGIKNNSFIVVFVFKVALHHGKFVKVCEQG